MNLIYLFFAFALLAFQVQAEPMPTREMEIWVQCDDRGPLFDGKLNIPVTLEGECKPFKGKDEGAQMMPTSYQLTVEFNDLSYVFHPSFYGPKSGLTEYNLVVYFGSKTCDMDSLQSFYKYGSVALETHSKRQVAVGLYQSADKKFYGTIGSCQYQTK